METEGNKKIFESVKRIISGKLGDFVADSLIRVNCKKIGIEPIDLDAIHFPEFVKGLRVSLILFLKEEEIDQIIKELENIK